MKQEKVAAVGMSPCFIPCFPFFSNHPFSSTKSKIVMFALRAARPSARLVARRSTSTSAQDAAPAVAAPAAAAPAPAAGGEAVHFAGQSKCCVWFLREVCRPFLRPPPASK
jgi:hypothetical protein